MERKHRICSFGFVLSAIKCENNKRFVLMHLPGKITYKVRFHQTRGCLHRFGLWLGGRVQSLIALSRALTFSLNISVSEHLSPAGDRRDDPNGGQEWGREDQLFRVQGDNIIYKYHVFFWQQHLQISYHISNLNLARPCHVRIWGIQFAKSCQRSWALLCSRCSSKFWNGIFSPLSPQIYFYNILAIGYTTIAPTKCFKVMLGAVPLLIPDPVILKPREPLTTISATPTPSPRPMVTKFWRKRNFVTGNITRRFQKKRGNLGKG